MDAGLELADVVEVDLGLQRTGEVMKMDADLERAGEVVIKWVVRRAERWREVRALAGGPLSSAANRRVREPPISRRRYPL